jgi:hypothetical protein
MTKNHFHTKLPFFQTTSFDDQPELQISKTVAEFREFKGIPNPSDWYPEFIFHRQWSSELPSSMSVQVWNTDTDTLHVDFGALPIFTVFFQHYQVIIDGQARIVTMFSGIYDSVTTMPSGNYQYRVTIGAYRFYSEIWEVCDLKYNTTFHKHFTRFVYYAACNFGGINYSILPNYKNNLWIPSEGIMPESVLVEENATNLQSEVVSSRQEILKTHLFACPRLTVAMVDAINSMAMYANGENRKLYLIGRNAYDSKIFIKGLDVEKPDYSISELCPSLKIRVQIDPMLASDDCCETQEIVSFVGKVPPSANVSKVNSTTIRVQKNFTLGDWIAQGLLPAWSLVRIQYSKDSGAFQLLPTTYSYMQLFSGVNVSGLAPGSYVFRIQLKTIASGSESHWSNNSVGINLP